jgi:hypothetical protein
MAKKGINKILADSKKTVADLEKATARFQANAPKTTPTATGTPFGQAGSYVDSFVNSPSNFTYGSGNPLNTAVDPYNPVPKSGTPTGTPTGTGSGTPTGTGGLLPGETINGNQLLLNGKPFAGMKNGILYVNGYRQDQYNPDGTDRKKPDPGSTALSTTTTRALGRDAFANTLALIFGAAEASQPYVSKLYDLVSGFYNSGSTIDEALNLAIREAKTKNVIPEFTARFAGIFALEEQLRQGKAVSVPTIAEFFAAEAKMGEVLTAAGLGDLATQEFLGGVIGKGKSVLEVTNLISETFTTIDNAPAALKQTLATYFPGVDRASIAKALLMGAEGAAELDKKIRGISVLSAAGSQGISTDLTSASDIAAQGYDYQQSLTGFGTVKQLERANQLASLTGDKFTQEQAISATFGKSIEEKKKLEKISELEQSRYAGRSGLARGALASQARGTGLI